MLGVLSASGDDRVDGYQPPESRLSFEPLRTFLMEVQRHSLLFYITLSIGRTISSNVLPLFEALDMIRMAKAGWEASFVDSDVTLALVRGVGGGADLAVPTRYAVGVSMCVLGLHRAEASDDEFVDAMSCAR
ncbi:hypothetical protein HK101_002730 [Irineochytrium annulatum]|nr:hypothetical protein HK101_002730 [Irineochytrium annulatum]